MATNPVDIERRRFYTADDRRANQNVAPQGARQRSFSIERRYQDGSVERVHVHNNLHNGNPQFEHVIGGRNSDGSTWGRPPRPQR